MIGYKAFEHNWTCLGFQYQIGQTYEMPENEIKLCRKGFHFCQWAMDVFAYYNGNNDVYAEIKAEGNILQDNNKCVTNKITIVKPLSKQEMINQIAFFVHRLDGTIDRNLYAHRLDGPVIEMVNGIKEWSGH